jgi:hypothetical protein
MHASGGALPRNSTPIAIEINFRKVESIIEAEFLPSEARFITHEQKREHRRAFLQIHAYDSDD